MSRILVVAVAVALSCTGPHVTASDHLKALGYSLVACGDESHGALCSGYAPGAADRTYYRCVVVDADGCDGGPFVACERTQEPAL